MIVKYVNHFLKLPFISSSRFSIFISPYKNTQRYDKKWIDALFSKSQNNFIEIEPLSKLLIDAKEKSEYYKIYKDLQNLILNIKEEETHKLTSVFLISSLLFIKTQERCFLTLLATNKKKINSQISILLTRIKENFVKNPKNIEINTLEDINSYLLFNFAKFLIAGIDHFKIYQYDLSKAYIDLHSNEANKTSSTNKKEQLKTEILLKLCLFYPLASRYSIVENQPSPFLKEIFGKLDLFPTFKNLFIMHLKSRSKDQAEINEKFSLNDSNFLQTLFSLSQETKNFDSTLSFFCDISYSNEFSVKFSNHILKYFSLILGNKKYQKLDRAKFFVEDIISNHIEILLTAIKNIQENLNVLPLNNVLNIIMFISRGSFLKYNYTVIFAFWEKSLIFMENEIKEMNFSQKVNLIYAMGKTGFLTEGIKPEFFNLLKPENLRNFHLNWEDILKIIKAGLILKQFNENNLKNTIDTIFIAIKSFPQPLCNKILNTLAPALLRIRYSDLEFWEFYFENLEKMIQDTTLLKFSIFFVLKAFPLIFDDKNANLKMANEKILQFKAIYYNKVLMDKRFDNFLEMKLQHYFSEIPEEKKTTGSLLESKLGTSLKKLGVSFIEQAQSNLFFIIYRLFILFF